MKKLAVLFLGFPAVAAMAADPYVGYVYPAGLRPGTTNRLVVGGQNFWGLCDAGVSGTGVRVLKVERMALSAPPTASQRAWLRTWLDGILERGDYARPAFPTNAAARLDEWTVNAWWTTLDQLDRRELEAVERDIHVSKNPLQMTPSLRQILFVDVEVAAEAECGRRAFCVWNAGGISPPRPLYVSPLPRVEEPPYAPPHRAAAPVPRTAQLPCILDGRIFPGETDRFELVLRRGERWTFDVTARELQPYVGDAVPGFFNAVLRLLGPDGREAAFADDRDRFLPDPRLDFTVPADGNYTLEIRDNLYRGREDFVYQVEITPAREREPSFAPQPTSSARSWWNPLSWAAPALRPGGEVAGCLAPGQTDEYAVEIEGPGRFVFELRARRAGSSLDGVLTLLDADGREIWRHDDVTNELFVGSIPQAELDARGCVDIADAGTRRYVIRVEDATGHGGPNYGYVLGLAREKPDFAVYASRSAFPARFGVRVPVTFRLVRSGGFTGPVSILEEPGYRFENACFPSGTNEVKAFFVGKERTEGPLRAVRVRAVGEPGGVAKVTDVIAADDCMQAFAWRHLLTARAFLVKDLFPSPPRVWNIRPSETLVLAGPGAEPALGNLTRLLFDLRRPRQAPEVRWTVEVPSAAPGKKERLVLVTPLPYDQYAPRTAPNRRSNGVRAAVAADVRAEAARRGIALADVHDALTQILRERPQLAVCGEDRTTFTPLAAWLALPKICEAVGDGGEVASVAIQAKTGRREVSGAFVRDAEVSTTKVTFVYQARALPLPATPAYRAADHVAQLTAKWNRETLRVAQLDPGTYAVACDGREVGRYSAVQLAKGVNLALLDTPGQRAAQAAAACVGTPAYKAARPVPVWIAVTRCP